MLYEVLEEGLKKQNVQTVIALIADPNPESVAFHENLGYRVAGRLTNCAYKLGQWRGMYYMEKFLGTHEEELKSFIPFPEVKR